MITNPNDLSPDFWLDGNDSTKVTKFTNVQNNKISIFQTSDINAYMLTPIPILTGGIPAFNGEAIYSNTIGGLTLANTNGVFDSIHKDMPFTIYFNFKAVNDKAGVTGTLLSTNNGSATQVGFWLGYYGSKIQFKISNGSAFVINMVSSTSWPYNQYNWGKVIYDGISYKMYINGVLVKTTPKVTTLSIVPASNDLKLFATGQYQNGLAGWTKNIIVFKRLLTSTEQADLDLWIANQTQTAWNGYANVYIKWGQSNQVGEGDNTAIASELNGKIDAMIYAGYTYSNSDAWDQLELGKNQSPPDEHPDTRHGMEMRFGYEMGPNCWIIKVAKDGRPLTKISGVDWNVASINEMYTHLVFSTSKALMDIEGEFNYTPIIKGIDGMQGEGDANTTTSGTGQGQYWGERYEDMMKGFIDAITTYNGYTHKGGWPVDQMDVVIFRIKDGAPNLDPIEVDAVQACQTNWGINGFVKYPTYNSKIRSFLMLSTDDVTRNADNLHYDTIGLDAGMAVPLANYYKR